MPEQAVPKAEVKTCRKVKRTQDVRVVCDPPHWLYECRREQYGSEEYWSAIAKQLEEWVKEFHEFIRDHRSQDPVQLNVERKQIEACSACGEQWEVGRYDEEEDDGRTHCFCCGAVVEETPDVD